MLVYARVPSMGLSVGSVIQDAAARVGGTPAPSGGGFVAGARNAVVDEAVKRGIIPPPPKLNRGGFVGGAQSAADQARARLPPAPAPPPTPPQASPIPANPATPNLPPQAGPANCAASSVWDPVTRSCKAKPLPACAAGMVRNANGVCVRPPPPANTAIPHDTPGTARPDTTPSGPGATDGPTNSPPPLIVTGSGPGTGGGGGGGGGGPVGPSQPAADSVGGGGSVTYDASGAPVQEASGLPFGLTPQKIAIGVGVALAGFYLYKQSAKKGR